MEFNTAFFHYILPKICNTSILLTSLLIYSEKKKHHATGLLLLVGTVCGLFIQALLTCFHASLATHLTLYQSHIQLVFSSLLFLCTTVLGFDMVKTLEQQKKSTSSFIIHLATMSTPTMFILNQGMDVNLYLIKHSRLTMNAASSTFLTSVFICSLLSLVLFAVIRRLPNRIQQCIYSIVLYFTGAVALANTFGYIESIRQRPVIVKSLVYTLRQSQKASISGIRRLFNATMGIKDVAETTNWIGTGYSLYWFCVSFGLMYKKILHHSK